ncbi:hypothetical protein ACIQCF_35950 [Streptomyces sp. NPDC088353]|uniref:hypothetical protein n=1 Tax=Streptomyces sp. NPDC088353 TaxID=3365855 RepID=UPI00382DD738
MAQELQAQAEVQNGRQEGQERHSIAEDHRQAAEKQADRRNHASDIEAPKGE